MTRIGVCVYISSLVIYHVHTLIYECVDRVVFYAQTRRGSTRVMGGNLDSEF